MAVSFNNLGSHGRLGNQMFQYASMRGVTLRNELTLMVPPPDSITSDNYGIFECFNMKNTHDLLFGFQKTVPSYNVDDFHFNKDLYYLCPDNVDVVGYLQTEKYFIKYEDKIREEFSIKNKINNVVLDKYAKYLEDSPVFLHVRRGDPNLWWAYTNLPDHHPVCREDYYSQALKNFSDNTRVIVISDSIEWCKQQEWLSGSRFIYSDLSEEKYNDGAAVPYYDLALMSLCSGGVIANSSLSWWGAWLIKDPSNPIIAPKVWFGKALDYYNMDDLIPSRLIKL